MAVEPDRGEIATAEPLLLRVWELVRSSAPVYARGMAMLDDLLGDGGSPLYLPVMRGQLSSQLKLIIAALEGSQDTEPLQQGYGERLRPRPRGNCYGSREV